MPKVKSWEKSRSVERKTKRKPCGGTSYGSQGCDPPRKVKRGPMGRGGVGSGGEESTRRLRGGEEILIASDRLPLVRCRGRKKDPLGTTASMTSLCIDRVDKL